jgi:hypothetical protein
MSKRYIPIARKFFESEEWTVPRIFSEQEAWLDMVFLACFADHDIDLGKEGILHLERGEFYYPQRQLAKRWGWPLSKVNRFLARLAESTNPRIEKVLRETRNETHIETQSETQITVVRLCNYARYNKVDNKSETRNETQSETQVETQITVVRLCNYARYNKADNKSETHIETQSETQNETLNNKGYNNKGVKNTHTHYTELKDLFVRACWRAHTSAEACAEACNVSEEIILFCQHNPDANNEHKEYCRQDRMYYIMFEFYRCYHALQRSFPKPLLPAQMQELVRLYDISDIWRIIEAIDNKRERVRGNSLFKTIKQWATTDIIIANRRREQLN